MRDAVGADRARLDVIAAGQQEQQEAEQRTGMAHGGLPRIARPHAVATAPASREAWDSRAQRRSINAATTPSPAASPTQMPSGPKPAHTASPTPTGIPSPQ